MARATRIAVLDRGRLAQLASPRTLYREPATPMVAGFVGQGALVEGTVLSAPAEGRVRVSLFGTELVVRCAPAQREGAALICLRPENLEPDDGGPVEARVVRAVYKGGFVLAEVEPAVQPGIRLPLRLHGEARVAPGELLRLAVRDGWVVPINPARE